jgi:hypothetical protein
MKQLKHTMAVSPNPCARFIDWLRQGVQFAVIALCQPGALGSVGK